MLHSFARLFAAIVILGLLAALPATPARAQDGAWIQIEAHPELAIAEARAQAYARFLEGLQGYRLSSGWYGLVLGPLDRREARNLLSDLRAEGLIPRDSYVETINIYREQFWPAPAPSETDQAGATAQDPALLDDPAFFDSPDAPASEEIEIVILPEPDAGSATAGAAILTAPPGAEGQLDAAGRAEAELDRTAREAVQIALKWFGFYSAGIDADFGPATRRAMAGWQASRQEPATGVLTPAQREALMQAYRTEVSAVGLQTVTDTAAGITLSLPLGLVEFDRYEFPFAHYAAREGSGVQLLLISRPGDSDSLAALYEEMQTMEIVPPEGERNLRPDSFLLTGQDADLRSRTVARLQDGRIKGFTVAWTPDHDAQMRNNLPLMEASFTPLDGVLEPDVPATETATQTTTQSATETAAQETRPTPAPTPAPNAELVAGLDMRQPALTRSGFFIDDQGTVMTTTEVVDGCSRLMVDDLHSAEVSYRDDALGLAVLRPTTPLAPMSHARFAAEPAELGSEIAVAGFPFGGALGTAALSFGRMTELTWLNGDGTLQRLEVAARDTEAGGPVLDSTGAVLGMVMPPRMNGRDLPEDVRFALRADRLGTLMAEMGITPVQADQRPELGREALARLGAEMTVLVSCWP